MVHLKRTSQYLFGIIIPLCALHLHELDERGLRMTHNILRETLRRTEHKFPQPIGG